MNNKISAILLMGGSSTRFNGSVNKNFYLINEKPLFTYSLDILYSHPKIKEIIVVCITDLIEEVTDIINQNYSTKKEVKIITGGSTRAASVRNAIKVTSGEYTLIHDAARPLINSLDIDNLISSMSTYKLGTLFHKIYDTVKFVKDSVTTINRDYLKAVSTPQYFSKDLYEEILNPDIDDNLITDEISIFEQKYPVAFVEETTNNKKLTTKEDLEYIQYVLTKSNTYRIGHSFDFHPFEENRCLYLGGIKFDTNFGLKGHSDADVVYHVVAESIMGALGIGDLGTLFPDTDMKYHNMNSKYFVEEVMKHLKQQNYVVENIDIIIYLEKPNLKNYKVQMAQNIKSLISCQFVNVKATTLEKKGLIGRGEGIASEAVVLIKKI